VVDSSLAIDANGTLYFGSFDKKLYAVKAGWNLANSDWPKFRRDNLGTGRWPSYQIDANASPPEGGLITGAGVYNEGANATIYANPSVGYTFEHWSGDGVFDPNDANTTVPMTQARSVTAHFTLNSYTLSVTGGTGGSVSGTGTFSYGTGTPITAIPDTGHSFTGWTGDGIADLNASNTTILITEDRNVTATFTIDQHTLIVSGGAFGSDPAREGIAGVWRCQYWCGGIPVEDSIPRYGTESSSGHYQRVLIDGKGCRDVSILCNENGCVGGI
jgi:uncharacterized repeat protein (TIGR02543 family)